MTTSKATANRNLGQDYGSGSPATIYVALTTTAPDMTSTDNGSIVEPTGGQYDSYARVVITNDVTHFPAASGGIQQHGVTFNFPIAGGGSTAGIPLTHLVFLAGAGASRIIDTVPLPTGTAVVIGQGLVFPANSISIPER